METFDYGGVALVENDNWRNIFDAHNATVLSHEHEFEMQSDAIAIVAYGNTHPAISSGQFVYVKNHSSLTDGLYRAKAAIATNGALSTSNLTADGSGGLNALNADIASLNSKILSLTYATTFSKQVTNGTTLQNIGTITMPNDKAGIVTLSQSWASGKPDGCGLSDDASTFSETGTFKDAPSISSYYVKKGASAYVWAKLAVNSGTISVIAAVQYIA